MREQRMARLGRVAQMALVACVLAAPAVHAQTSTPPGRLLASNCFQCHGTDGNPTAGWERLAGKSANSIYQELVEMRGKAEADKGLMRVHALGYDDNQLRLIAQYFSQQKSAGKNKSGD